MAASSITAWGDALLRTPSQEYRVGTYPPFVPSRRPQSAPARRTLSVPRLVPQQPDLQLPQRKQQQQQQRQQTQLQNTYVQKFSRDVDELRTHSRTLNKLTISTQPTPKLRAAKEVADETSDYLPRKRQPDPQPDQRKTLDDNSSSYGSTHVSFAPAVTAIAPTAAPACTSSSAASAATKASAVDEDHELADTGDAECEEHDDEAEDEYNDPERLAQQQRLAREQREAAKQFGWATKIPTHAGKSAKLHEVVVSLVAPPTPLSHHVTPGIPGGGLLRHSSTPVIPLHGAAHFYLTTGIEPRSLLPKPPPPPQGRRVMGEKKGERAAQRRLEEKRRVERNAALVKEIMDRVKRESPNWVAPAAALSAPASAPAPAAPAQDGSQGKWTPWATPRGEPPAHEVHEALKAMQASTNRLHDTVSYVQQASFRLQNQLGFSPPAELEDSDMSDPLSTLALGPAQRARAVLEGSGRLGNGSRGLRCYW